MEIGGTQAILYDALSGSSLAQAVKWQIEERSANGWIVRDLGQPTMSQDNDGVYHRVIVKGTVDNVLNVILYFEAGRSDAPQKGLEITADLQSTGGHGQYRVVWSVEMLPSNYSSSRTWWGTSLARLASPYNRLLDSQ